MNSATHKIYSTDDSSLLYVVNGKHVEEKLSVGMNPLYVGINSHTNRIYVDNSGDTTVTVVDGSK